MVGQKSGLSVLFLFLFIQLSKLCIINSCFCVYFRVLRHYVPDIYYDEIIRIKLWSIKSTEQETFFSGRDMQQLLWTKKCISLVEAVVVDLVVNMMNRQVTQSI